MEEWRPLAVALLLLVLIVLVPLATVAARRRSSGSSPGVRAAAPMSLGRTIAPPPVPAPPVAPPAIAPPVAARLEVPVPPPAVPGVVPPVELPEPAPPEYPEPIAPVEIRFDDGGEILGISADSARAREFARIADVLLHDLGARDER